VINRDKTAPEEKGAAVQTGRPKSKGGNAQKYFGQQQNIIDVNAALQKYVIASHKFQDVNQY